MFPLQTADNAGLEQGRPGNRARLPESGMQSNRGEAQRAMPIKVELADWEINDITRALSALGQVFAARGDIEAAKWTYHLARAINRHNPGWLERRAAEQKKVAEETAAQQEAAVAHEKKDGPQIH